MPKRQKAKKNPPGEKPENSQNRQAGWRKVEKKGAVVGKKKSRGIDGGTRGTSGSARLRGTPEARRNAAYAPMKPSSSARSLKAELERANGADQDAGSSGFSVAENAAAGRGGTAG